MRIVNHVPNAMYPIYVSEVAPHLHPCDIAC